MKATTKALASESKVANPADMSFFRLTPKLRCV